MMLLLAFLLLTPPDETQQDILRIIYDVEMIGPERHLSAKLALNKLDEQHFSISCRKNPGGTLFTCWATPQETYLLVPKKNQAFAGPETQPFHLFPGGPQLHRLRWLALLESPQPGPVGDYLLTIEGDWFVLTQAEEGLILRWKERSRTSKNRFNTRVLIPKRQSETPLDLDRLASYWDGSELE